MPKLNDTQAVLLASAAQRENGSIYPLPESLTPSTRLTATVGKLLRLALIEESETSSAAEVSRTDGDLRFGLFITPAGVQAIGIEPQASGDGQVPSPTPPATAPHKSKNNEVLAMLGREQGVTLTELVEVTGWLPHSARAALTILRRKGHMIARGKRGDVTCYHLQQSSAA